MTIAALERAEAGSFPMCPASDTYAFKVAATRITRQTIINVTDGV
jgi:hypothetical protein